MSKYEITTETQLKAAKQIRDDIEDAIKLYKFKYKPTHCYGKGSNVPRGELFINADRYRTFYYQNS